MDDNERQELLARIAELEAELEERNERVNELVTELDRVERYCDGAAGVIRSIADGMSPHRSLRPRWH